MKRGGSVKQKNLSRWIYGITLVVLAFVLGYLAGRGGRTAPVQVTVLAAEERSDNPAEQVLKETEPEEPVLPVPTPNTPLDLNQADQAALETLPGIGPELAARIVEYRKTIGLFVDPTQLMDVEGIGEKRFAAIEQLVTVEDNDENIGSG